MPDASVLPKASTIRRLKKAVEKIKDEELKYLFKNIRGETKVKCWNCNGKRYQEMDI